MSACTDVSNFRFAEFIPRFEDGEIRGGKFPSHSLLLGMECVPKSMSLYIFISVVFFSVSFALLACFLHKASDIS